MMGMLWIVVAAILIVGPISLLVWDRSLRNKNKEPETTRVNAGKITLDIHFKDGTVWKEYQVFVGEVQEKIAAFTVFPVALFKPFIMHQGVHSAEDQLDDWLSTNDASTVFCERYGQRSNPAETVGYPLHEVLKFVEHHEDHFVNVREGFWRE